jgi:hypothetical protein
MSSLFIASIGLGLAETKNLYSFLSTVYQIFKMTLCRRETEYKKVTFSVKTNELVFFDRLEKRTDCPGFGTEDKSAFL